MTHHSHRHHSIFTSCFGSLEYSLRCVPLELSIFKIRFDIKKCHRSESCAWFLKITSSLKSRTRCKTFVDVFASVWHSFEWSRRTSVVTKQTNIKTKTLYVLLPKMHITLFDMYKIRIAYKHKYVNFVLVKSKASEFLNWVEKCFAWFLQRDTHESVYEKSMQVKAYYSCSFSLMPSIEYTSKFTKIFNIQNFNFYSFII